MRSDYSSKLWLQRPFVKTTAEVRIWVSDCIPQNKENYEELLYVPIYVNRLGLIMGTPIFVWCRLFNELRPWFSSVVLGQSDHYEYIKHTGWKRECFHNKTWHCLSPLNSVMRNSSIRGDDKSSIGRVFFTPSEVEVKNGGPPAFGRHLGWPHFRFPKMRSSNMATGRGRAAIFHLHLTRGRKTRPRFWMTSFPPPPSWIQDGGGGYDVCRTSRRLPHSWVILVQHWRLTLLILKKASDR